MKSKLLFYTLALGVAVNLTYSASAEEHHHKLTDEIFAKKAAAGGLTEVDLGKIAQQNGESQDVKDFGAKMVTDHGKANDSLKDVATKDNLTIPDKPNAEQQAMIDRLSKKTGAAFDKAYIHAMVRAHEMDKALFSQEIDTAKNPDLKQFAQDTLPVITEHLTMIEGMAGSGSTAKTESSSAPSPAMATAPTTGDVGAGKSGLAPGSNANPVPAPAPAASTDASAPASATAPTAPTTGDVGAGKSGLAPGSNANPVPAATP